MEFFASSREHREIDGNASMNKLTNMEAQRVINCLEDSLDRLSLLSFLPAGNPDAMLLEAFAADNALQLNQHLQAEWQLEEAYVMSAARNAGRTTDGGTNEITEQLQQRVRQVCRQLKKNPAAVETLYGQGGAVRTENFSRFHSFLSDLTLVTYRKLATTVEEEATSKTRMHDLVERERSAEDERNALQQTLQVQRIERERETSSMEQLTTKLKAELHDITQNNEMERESIHQESKERRGEANADYESKMKKLQDRFDALTQEMATQTEKHRELEASLRKKKEKKEAELGTKIDEFDVAMGGKKQEIEDLKVLTKKEKEELQDLEEYFAKVDANEAQSQEEKRILTEFKKRMDAANGILDRAATHFQKIHRGNMTRKMLKESGSKKKGKKKK